MFNDVLTYFKSGGRFKTYNGLEASYVDTNDDGTINVHIYEKVFGGKFSKQPTKTITLTNHLKVSKDVSCICDLDIVGSPINIKRSTDFDVGVLMAHFTLGKYAILRNGMKAKFRKSLFLNGDTFIGYQFDIYDEKRPGVIEFIKATYDENLNIKQIDAPITLDLMFNPHDIIGYYGKSGGIK